jgi:hypothetical protein
MPAPAPLLIQVVASLMPGRNGVGDHALALGHEIQSAFGINTAFAVVNSNESCSLPYPTIFCSPSRLLENCLKLAQERPAAVLVHVSGYGYSRDGAPTLLADALDEVKASGRFRLGVYFHELFATGMPWRSAFWHTRRQQNAVRRIAAQCSLIVTNTAYHAEWLERQSQRRGGAPVERISVFSTVGEADEPAAFEQRDAALVVFGLAGGRECSYRQLAAAGNLVHALGVEEILDVGPEGNLPAQVQGIRVKRMGLLPGGEVAAVFSRARFGVVHHPWFCLAKSSIFAAYCAQGVVPVVTKPFSQEVDGLAEGLQVVTPRTAACAARSAWEDRSRAAWKWYRTHRLRVHAERYAKWLGELQ